jgi:putative (di)nucleoside polyphosphate hydrolase
MYQSIHEIVYCLVLHHGGELNQLNYYKDGINCRARMFDFTSLEPIFSNDGYRPNVGIVLSNDAGKVFWARRTQHDGWQFPQGGMHPDENPEQAMYRELKEEVGLERRHVHLVGHTSGWLHYDLPQQFFRSPFSTAARRRKRIRGQKQIWFLLIMNCDESSVRLDCSKKPEFDDWKWVDYWDAAEEIVDFKRNVYREALGELEHLMPELG